jgi:Tfp pilus assembly protein PilV
MQNFARTTGYTLIETIVAVLLFTVGGLALASTAGLVGRQLGTDSQRETAARVAASRMEKLRADCRVPSGQERVNGIESAWSVMRDGSTVRVTGTVSYATWSGPRSDTYTFSFLCE